MRVSTWVVLAFFLMISLVVVADRRRFTQPVPPQPAESATVLPPASGQSSSAPQPRTDPVQIQRDARELLELSQSLQLDIESVNHGLLPKDTLGKLKRIEKLSRHLRGELALQ